MINNQINEKRLIFIFELFEDNRDREDIFIILHSLLNCLNEDEIVLFYFDYAIYNLSLKKTVERYVYKRVSEKSNKKFSEIARGLLLKFQEESDYKKQLKIRTLLCQLIEEMPKEIIKEFFDVFIASHRILEKKKAYSVVHLIWSEEIRDILFEHFYNSYDENILGLIVANSTSKEVLDFVPMLWNSNFPSNSIKSSILRQIQDEDITDFSFLIDKEPSYYIFILALKKERIDQKLLVNIIHSIPEEKLSYVIWYLGLVKDWDMILEVVRKTKNTLVSNNEEDNIMSDSSPLVPNISNLF